MRLARRVAERRAVIRGYRQGLWHGGTPDGPTRPHPVRWDELPHRAFLAGFVIAGRITGRRSWALDRPGADDDRLATVMADRWTPPGARRRGVLRSSP